MTLLAGSPSRLEYARALVELGADRRRRGERAAARTRPFVMGSTSPSGVAPFDSLIAPAPSWPLRELGPAGNSGLGARH